MVEMSKDQHIKHELNLTPTLLCILSIVYIELLQEVI